MVSTESRHGRPDRTRNSLCRVVACTTFAGPPGFTAEQGGFCYAAFLNGGAGVSWSAAQAQCVAAGGVKANLATIRDASQKSAVLDNRCAGLVPAGYYWHIGLHDQHTEGTFQFVSGFNPTYARNNLFAAGQVRL